MENVRPEQSVPNAQWRVYIFEESQHRRVHDSSGAADDSAISIHQSKGRDDISRGIRI